MISIRRAAKEPYFALTIEIYSLHIDGTFIKIFRGGLISGGSCAGAILLSATLALGLAELRGTALFMTLAAAPAALAKFRRLKQTPKPSKFEMKFTRERGFEPARHG